MRRRIAPLTGLLALCLAGVARAGMPDATSFIADVEAQRVDPSTFDFARAGFWELDDDGRHRWDWDLLGVHFKPDGTRAPPLSEEFRDPFSGCDPASQGRIAAIVWTEVAMNSRDASEWNSTHSDLLKRLAKLDDQLSVAADVQEKSLEVAELLRRAARDRVLHEARDDATQSTRTDRPAEVQWLLVIHSRTLANICDNSDWLKTRVAQSGWFDAKKFGRAADEAAWQLLLHVTRDLDFQLDALEMLRKLPPESTSQQQLARLDDAMATYEGRGQRFGTRRLCNPHDGGSSLWPDLEDPAHVNERRARVGLEPLDPAPLAEDPNCPRLGVLGF